MKFVYWLLVVVSCVFGVLSMGMLLILKDAVLFFVALLCAVVSWPKTSWNAKPSGVAYGIPYYIVFEDGGYYFRANVYDHKIAAPHERTIRKAILERLQEAIAERAVDRMIGRLK